MIAEHLRNTAQQQAETHLLSPTLGELSLLSDAEIMEVLVDSQVDFSKLWEEFQKTNSTDSPDTPLFIERFSLFNRH